MTLYAILSDPKMLLLHFLGLVPILALAHYALNTWVRKRASR